MIRILFIYILFFITFIGYSQHCPVHPKINNLIKNGDFESGDDGSSSFGPYHTKWVYGKPLKYSSPGYYYIGKDPNYFNPGFPVFYDHTKQDGSGNMLMIDGTPEIYQIAWQQTVHVIAGTNYKFEGWFTSLSNDIRANIAIRIREYTNLTIIIPVFNPSSTGDWSLKTSTWLAPITEDITIELVDLNPNGDGPMGNDYAIDDLKFYPTCEGTNLGPKPNLGNDIQLLCNNPGSSILLKTNIPAISPILFTWFQDTTKLASIANTLTVTQIGKYKVCVDSMACFHLDSVTIVNVFDTIQLTIKDAICYDSLNGSIELGFKNNLYPSNFIYSWSNGVATKDNPRVKAGTYTVTINDGNNCKITAQTSISSPSEIIVTPSIKNSICFGANDGYIKLGVKGGVPFAKTPYNYLWNNSATTDNLLNMPAGTYTITVKDKNNCPSIKNIIITSPSIISLNPTINNINCYNGDDGSILLNVSGGYGIYNYKWNNKTTDSQQQNLRKGNFTVTITDGNQCKMSGQYTLTEPNPISISFIADSSTCLNSDGMATAIVTGGTGTGFSYHWDAPGHPSSTSISGLGAGIYNLTVTDNASTVCIKIASVGISDKNQVKIKMDSTNLTCYQSGDGTAEVTLLGYATPPMTMAWDGNPANSTSSISSLDAGPHHILITDGNGCKIVGGVQLSEPEILLIDLSTIDPTCPQTPTGDIQLKYRGGIGTITYKWSNAETSQNLINKVSGIYEVTITDTHTCTASSKTSLDDIIPFTADTLTTPTLCTKATGTATIINRNYNNVILHWSIPTLPVDTMIIDQPKGIYTLTITYANNCVATKTLEIKPPPSPRISNVLVDSVRCGGIFGCDGRISITVTPADAIISWPQLGINGLSAQDLCGNQSYTAIATNSAGCSDSITKQVPIGVNIKTTIKTVNDSCNLAKGKAFVTVNGYNNYNNLHFKWDNFTKDTIKDVNNLEESTYHVRIFDDSSNCFIINNVSIGNYGWIKSDYNFSPQNLSVSDSLISFYDYTTSNPKIVSWSWSFDDGEYSSLENPFHYFIQKGIYKVSLITKNSYGCTNMITKLLDVKDSYQIYIPNAFTVNNDNVNEVFIPQGTNINEYSYEFRVYNRWGNQLFYTASLYEGWNGRLNNTSNSIEEAGTYLYCIRFKDVSGSAHEFNGKFLLIR